MKTVGKQLQDARAAKGWSPELAARETKIRVDRLHDLEVDDYSNFSSPTYARGFVRTYARALGLDEYKILRQLDNKLPEDDNASFANDSGVAYMPEPSQVSKPFEFSRGVYIAGGVAATVLLLIGFILIQSYRAGYFASAPVATPAMPATNALPVAPETETARAMPADGSAPPVALPVDNQPAAIAVAAPATSPTDTSSAPRALPVNPADLAATSGKPAAATAPVAPPNAAPARPTAPVAQPVEAAPVVAVVPTPSPASVTAAPSTAPSITPVADAAPADASASVPATADTTASSIVPTTTTTPPRALPVDLNAANAPASPAASAADATVPASTRALSAHSSSARQSNAGSTVNVAAANSATQSLIASTASPEPPPAPVAQPIPASALTGTPDNTGTASAPMAETSSPDNSAPSSLGPVALSTPPQASRADSAAALTGASSSSDAALSAPAPGAGSSGKFRGQRLVLTASHDSFVRVIALDGSNGGQVRFASLLHSGESISFNDRRYSINVADPSAVDIALDGINYGPHSENSAPDTFTVESHTP